MGRKALQLLESAMLTKNSLACCGLDPDLRRLPPDITSLPCTDEEKVFHFLTQVIDGAAPHVCAFKAQKAFFDTFRGGHQLLRDIIVYAHSSCAELPIFIDCKIGDIANTMSVYLENIFGTLEADGVVVNPYMGDEVFLPFHQLPDKAALVLVRTSNSGAAVLQDVPLTAGQPLWLHVLRLVVNRWNAANNLVPVIASKVDPYWLQVRQIVPDCMPIFVAGVGAQGGSVDGLQQLLNSKRAGLCINSSRALLYPENTGTGWREDVTRAVTEFKDRLNHLRWTA